MPATKAKTLPEFSESESVDYNIADKINATYTRLRSILTEEANVRKTLGALFLKQKEEANEAVWRAQYHLAFVNNEQARMQDLLRKETEAANLTAGTIVGGVAAFMNENPTDCHYGIAGNPLSADKVPEEEKMKKESQKNQWEDEGTEQAERHQLEERRQLEEDQLPQDLEELERQEVFIAEDECITWADEEVRTLAQREEALLIREEQFAEELRKQQQVICAVIKEVICTTIIEAVKVINARQQQAEVDIHTNDEEEPTCQEEHLLIEDPDETAHRADPALDNFPLPDIPHINTTTTKKKTKEKGKRQLPVYTNFQPAPPSSPPPQVETLAKRFW